MINHVTSAITAALTAAACPKHAAESEACRPAPTTPRPITLKPISNADWRGYCGAGGWRDWEATKGRPTHDHERPLHAELGGPGLQHGDIIADAEGVEVSLFYADRWHAPGGGTRSFVLSVDLKSQAVAEAFVTALFGTGPFDPTDHARLTALGFEDMGEI